MTGVDTTGMLVRVGRAHTIPPAIARLSSASDGEIRASLARFLGLAGIGPDRAGRILRCSRSAYLADLAAAATMPEDDELDGAASERGSMIADRPPTPSASIPAAGRARRPGVSAALIKRLRAEFGPGRSSEDGRPLGDRPEVRAWLESLEVRDAR